MTRRRLFLWTEIVLVVALVVVGGWFAVQHSLDHAFANLDVGPLETTVKKAAADLVVVKRNPDTPAARSQGYLVAYEQNPQGFQADARLFDTWFTAVQLGVATFKDAPQGDWIRSSSESVYVPAAQRVDPWNHTFCLLRRADTLAIISAGPAAPSSPTCKNVSVEAGELAKLPHKKLLQTPAGFLILVLDADQLAVPERSLKP